MSAARNKAYASALFAVASAETDLGSVQDELFQFGRIVQGSDELRERLADATLPPARRAQLVEDILAGKANKVTVALVSMVVAAGRGRDLPDIVHELNTLAAAEAGKEVAVVRTAVELSEDQKQRLAQALERATGTPVDLRVVIDPSVIGGVVAQVGDTVIDGTVRRRLDQLKQAI